MIEEPGSFSDGQDNRGRQPELAEPIFLDEKPGRAVVLLLSMMIALL